MGPRRGRTHCHPDRTYIAPRLILSCLTLLLFSVPATPQQGRDSASGTSATPQHLQLLEPGKPIEYQVVGGQTHAYEINLAARQYLQVDIERRGIDITVVFRGPDGDLLAEVDSRNGVTGRRRVSVLAKETGSHRVEVRSLGEKATTGWYKLLISELRDATAQEVRRVDAYRAFAEGERLRKQGSSETLKAAIEKYADALSKYRSVNDSVGEAQTLSSAGRTHTLLGRMPDALHHFDQALPLYRAAGDRQGEAQTLTNIGLIHSNVGEPQKALSYYTEALSLHRTVGDRQNEGNTLNNIGVVYGDTGKPKEALVFHEQALEVRRSLGDLQGTAVTLSNIGVIHHNRGDLKMALDYYNESLELRRRIGDRRGEAMAIDNIGLVYRSLADPHKALDYYTRSLALRQTLGDQRGEANTVSNIGSVYIDLGEPQKALDHFNKALPLRRVVKDRRGEAWTLNSLGYVYWKLGESERAIEYYNQALPLHRAVSNRQGEASTLSSIASVYGSLGDLRKELDYILKALAIFREIGDRLKEATPLNNIGVVYNELGDPRRALDYFGQALSRRRELLDRMGEASTLSNIGAAFAALGEPQKALDHFNQALLLYRSFEGGGDDVLTLGRIARVYRDLGDLNEARRHFEIAVHAAETLRFKVVSDDLRTSYLSSVQQYYEGLTDVLMQLHRQYPTKGNNAVALQTIERARARSLLDLLNEARADIRQGVDQKLLERERSLRQLLAAKADRQTRLLGGVHTREQADTAAKEIAKLFAEYEDVKMEIRQTSPRYAALTQPQPLGAQEIMKLLDRDTVLLEYSLGEERSYLWAVTPDSVDSYELPKRVEIEAAARRFYELLTAPNEQKAGETEQQKWERIARAEAELPKAGNALSQMLLGPVARQLGTKRLIVVSDGAVRYVPFAALTDPAAAHIGAKNQRQRQQPLIVNHEIVSLPSASVLGVLRRELSQRKPATKAVAILADPVFADSDPRVKAIKKEQANGGNQPLVAHTRSPNNAATAATSLSGSEPHDSVERAFSEVATQEVSGVPRLPFSRREAEAIFAAVPTGQGMKALDFAANLATATSAELSQYRIIHFATHGLLNSRHPELSGIVLSLVDEQGQPIDGFLRLNEIYNLNLPAELVVLSACRTGLGKEIKGEGLVGLTRGFMYAGAKRIVASLWKVDDAGTAELMKRFYRGVLSEGARPAAALRAAQVEMWKTDRWRSPYHWAAFELQGEWK